MNTILENCWATPDDDPNNALSYDIFIGGCPADLLDVQDGILEVLSNGQSSVSGFSIDSFQFQADDSLVKELYFHCDVELCTENCEPSCNARKRRSGAPSTVNLNVGPIHLGHDHHYHHGHHHGHQHEHDHHHP